MIVLIVLGHNATVGQKIMEIRNILKLTFENMKLFLKYANSNDFMMLKKRDSMD